jgi:hypothetical protein
MDVSFGASTIVDSLACIPSPSWLPTSLTSIGAAVGWWHQWHLHQWRLHRCPQMEEGQEHRSRDVKTSRYFFHFFIIAVDFFLCLTVYLIQNICLNI